MTRRRFYAQPNAFSSDLKSLTLQAEEARHLRDVLRLRPGDRVHVFDGAGKEFECSIEESRKDTARLQVLAEVEPARSESPLQLTLAVALLKSDKFDLVVQKATELGVARVVPVATKLADIRLRDDSDAHKRVTRWQRIALEASKQSGRALVPEVTPPISFPELVQTEDAAGQRRLMFSERDGQSLLEMENILDADQRQVLALVGSEGGWTDEEISLARDNNWGVVTLGGRTLRAETAAIAATVLLQYLYGDLS
ncbi:MAG: 16S rRNA (uracil(1498)-N(3))-methyltransferase [Pyrinomonadaceae bacterium]|nr:16S rRNA (uracil(1498)-N(3))-methyltransferase [Pyrinomonadaceae bacterium]